MNLPTRRTVHGETAPRTEGDLDTYGPFHGPHWMSVLTDCYGYEPVLIETRGADSSTGMLPLAEVSIPGRKHGASLPFTDFCDPFTTDNESSAALLGKAIEHGQSHRWRYVELRGGADLIGPGIPQYCTYYGHRVSVAQSRGDLWLQLHENARRNIRKAQKQEVVFRCDTDWSTVKLYYDLHCRTRKKHGLPPQSERFFKIVQKNMLDKGDGFAGVALYRNIPVAATIFLKFDSAAVYKFGASDERYLNVRANTFVMWKSILQCKEMSAKIVYMGRTDMENEGLRRYKNEFGAVEYLVPYYRFDFQKKTFIKGPNKSHPVKGPLTWMPLPVLRLTGKLLYPFMG